MLARIGSAAILVGVALIGTSGPAHATFTENTIGCSGSAVITDPDGETFSISAADAEVDVPREGVAQWRGAITTTTHNHAGAVRLKVAFWNITLDSWGRSDNANDENSSADDFTIPGFVKQLPPGRYVVSGFHSGNEGSCAGNITADLQGSPLDSALGIASLAGTVIGAGVMAMAARPKVY